MREVSERKCRRALQCRNRIGRGDWFMCTAATYRTKDFYFGRTLDYEFSYGEEVTVTPRRYVFDFHSMGRVESHYAMIGMAHVEEDYPLYYDAVNEKGLGMAGLNFVGNAHYGEAVQGRDNVAVYELIQWILCQCASVRDAVELLNRINLIPVSFRGKFPAAQLHWILADREETVTVEARGDGLKILDNPAGVLANNPPFEEQMFQLNNYMNLSPKPPQNRFSGRLPLEAYSRGMGALGLPGDLSSQSRFVRAAFVRMNSVSGDSEPESVSQFFHILGAVDQQRGCCELEDGKFEITIYTSCCNAEKGIYYYTTYDNHQISAVDMHREALDKDKLVRYPLISGEQVCWQN